MFDTTKVRQDYADYAGEMKICQSHIFVLVKLYFGAINFRILCVCLRKFRANRSGSFCFIVLQNQSPRLLLTIFWKEKIFIATHLLEPSPNFCGIYFRIFCICLQIIRENRSSSFCFIVSRKHLLRHLLTISVVREHNFDAARNRQNMHHNDFDFIFCKISMSTNVQ